MRSLGVFVCLISFAEWLDGEISGIRQYVLLQTPAMAAVFAAALLSEGRS
jgi:hypothetical protein